MLYLRILSQLMLIGVFKACDSIYGPSASLAQLGEFPYMVKIMPLLRSRMAHCGGAIIDSTHILTAAHCVFGYLEEEISVIAGAVDLFSIFRIEQPSVQRIHIHEKYLLNETKCGRWNQFQKWYRSTWSCYQNEVENCLPEHDIAVLTLIDALPFGDYIKAVNLPDPYISPVCQICEFAGWGKTEKDGSVPNHLYSTQMIILSHRECRVRSTTLHSSEFCAIDPFLETCGLTGDSGAPLVSNNVVYGIYIRGADNPLDTSVFTKVSVFLEFIRKALEE